ncbi:unnamed protein product [Parajaminaea phylloscopi]
MPRARYVDDGILGDVVTFQELYLFRLHTNYLLGGVLIHAVGCTLSVVMFLMLYSIASHRLRRSPITIMMAAAITCAALGASTSVAVIWLRMGTSEDEDRHSAIFMTRLSVVTYIATAFAVLLTDSTLIPRILLWFPREDPTAYRRGLTFVAFPLFLKVPRIAFTLLGAYMVYHYGDCPPLILILEPYGFLLAFIDEGYATLILCHKLIRVGWKPHRKGANEHLDSMVTVVRRTVFLSVASFAIPSVLTMIAFVLQEVGTPVVRFKMWCVSLHMYLLIVGASFTCLWPMIKADRIKAVRNVDASRKQVCHFDVDMDHDLNYAVASRLHAIGVSTRQDRRKATESGLATTLALGVDRNKEPSKKLAVVTTLSSHRNIHNRSGCRSEQVGDSPSSCAGARPLDHASSLSDLGRVTIRRSHSPRVPREDYFSFPGPEDNDLEAVRPPVKHRSSWHRMLPRHLGLSSPSEEPGSHSPTPAPESDVPSTPYSANSEKAALTFADHSGGHITLPQHVLNRQTVTEVPTAVAEACEVLYEKLAAQLNDSAHADYLPEDLADAERLSRMDRNSSRAGHQRRSRDREEAAPFSSWVEGDRRYLDAYGSLVGSCVNSDADHTRRGGDISGGGSRRRASRNNTGSARQRIYSHEVDGRRLSSRGKVPSSQTDGSIGHITFETETQVSLS